MSLSIVSRAIATFAMVALPISATAVVVNDPVTNKEYNPCYPDADCRNKGQRAPVPTEPERPPHCDVGCVILIAVVAGLIAALVKHLTDNHLASRSELDEGGPRFPAEQGVGQFEAQGYAKAGWPIVVEYRSDPNTRTWIEIDSGVHNEKTTIELPSHDERGVEVVRFNPAIWSAGDAPVPARYSVHSADSVGSQRVVEHSPLMVFGIGAGPRAVGSMTLFITRLDPAETAQPDNVGFSLKSLRLFDRSVVEMLKLPRPGETRLTLAGVEKHFPLARGDIEGTWSAMQGRSASGAPAGYYALQSRAWLVGSNHDERDWTGAFGPNYVHVQ